MKKKVLAITLATMLLTLGLVFAAPAGAHIESSPFPTDLLAGQNMDVGDVEVWNDGDNLHVTYKITDPDWVITETHLYVGKTGSPTTPPPTTAPGQFPYDDDDADSVTDTMVTYVIPLNQICGYKMQLNRKGKPTGVMIVDTGTQPGVVPCEDVCIAAHAVVEKCVVESFEFVPELTWERSSEVGVAVYPGYGAQWTEEQGFAIALDPETIVWDGGTIGQYFTGYSTRSDIGWASWVCTQNPAGKSLTGTDLRRFQANFDIPVGYSVTGGTLGSVNPGYEDVIPMNDNIYIFVNEGLTFWGGTISLAGLDPARTHFLGMERRPTEPQDKAAFPETDGWHMDGAIPEISSGLFVEGGNVLDVFAEELWTGGGMHELGLTLQVEQTTCETETAWAGGTVIRPDKNWAMYFPYHVQGPRVAVGNQLRGLGEGGVRYKSFANTGSREMYVGIPDLGVGANRVETDFSWSSPGTHTVSFAYDEANNKLIGTVDGTTLEWTNISGTADPGKWNAMLISVVNRDSGTTVDFNNVEINGWSLGDFSGVSWKDWTVSWDGFDDSWTLTGEIELAGTFSGSSELSKIQIVVGQHT
jgi:hypothetical protein